MVRADADRDKVAANQHPVRAADKDALVVDNLVQVADRAVEQVADLRVGTVRVVVQRPCCTVPVGVVDKS